ncbi:MAG: twin-arginine translocase TatA/TatE family subunit [Acidobacteriota bacterium]
MVGPLGFPELLFIMLLALLLFGPRELPKIGRTLGKGMAELRKATTELKRTIDAEMIEEEVRQSRELLRSGKETVRSIRNLDPRRMLDDDSSSAKSDPKQTSDTQAESETAKSAVSEPETAMDSAAASAPSEETAEVDTHAPEPSSAEPDDRVARGQAIVAETAEADSESVDKAEATPS